LVSLGNYFVLIHDWISFYALHNAKLELDSIVGIETVHGWAIKELRFDYRRMEEISLHFKATKVFTILAFSLISTYIFFNLNIYLSTLTVDLLLIITKYVLRKLFHFNVVIRFCESHSAVSKSEFARVRSTAGLISPSSIFMSLFADVLWACQLAHSSDKLRQRQCVSCLSAG
jgi:hypothetical protein